MLVTLRLALVGLGTWAATGHLPVYAGARLREHVEVVALCSRDRAKAHAWADARGIPGAYDNLEQLLDETVPDVVAVCTPDDAHVTPALAALSAGCDVLLEKPLATTLKGALAILEASKATGRTVVTLLHKRADALWAEAAARVATGRYGPLQAGTILIENPLTVPNGDYFTSELATRTDPNHFLGTHVYDLLRYITGLDPHRVSARRYEGRLAADGIATADSYKADIEMHGGASVSILCAWNLPTASPALTKQTMHLHFEDGELELDGTRRGFIEHGPDGYNYVNPYFLRSTPAGPVGYGALFIEEAVFSLTKKAPSAIDLPTLEDAWWATAVAEAVATSAESGTNVEVQQSLGAAL